MLSLSVISASLITLALIFYTVGVWSERLTKYLKFWHVVIFWIGFAFDIGGTLAMHKLAKAPFDILDIHTLTGQIALWLMFIHSMWATNVIKLNNNVLRSKFHKYSLIVWYIWLVPYFGGMYMGITK